jgi:NAD(P)-dependent dehydrogenase (short-subunit alcohol dehydrogenase family)
LLDLYRSHAQNHTTFTSHRFKTTKIHHEMAMQKSVLITGCSHGSIGHSLAMAFARRGFLVFATARNTSKIADSLSSQQNVEILTLDTTSQLSIDAAAKVVAKHTGGTLDVLINNAGSGLVMPFLDTGLDEARKVFEVNFWGVLMCVMGFKELVVRARGTIVNVSSIAGVAPNPYESAFPLSLREVQTRNRNRSKEWPMRVDTNLLIRNRHLQLIQSSPDPIRRDAPSRTQTPRRQCDIADDGYDPIKLVFEQRAASQAPRALVLPSCDREHQCGHDGH